MEQGNGSELLGPQDPRSRTIGIIRVAPDDERKSVLGAILTQEKLGRKQVAIVLPDGRNKAFQRPVDFDDLKNVKRRLQTQIIFIAADGSNAADFARQRHFPVYATLVNYARTLQDDNAPQGGGESKRSWAFGSGKRQAVQPPTPQHDDSSNAASDVVDPTDNENDRNALPSTPLILPIPINYASADATPPLGATTENMNAPFVESNESSPPIIDLSKRRNKVTTQLPPVVEPVPIPLPNPQPAPPTPFLPRTTTGTRTPTPIRRSSGQTAVVPPGVTRTNPITAPPPRRGTTSTRNPRGTRTRTRPLLIVLVAVLLVLLACGGIAFSARTSLAGFVAGLQPAAATITITPDKKVESTSYVIAAVMGTPNGDQRQVAARQLSGNAHSQSKTVNATGVGHTPGVAATGTLTFYNGSSTVYTVSANTILTDSQGVKVMNLEPASIPPGSPGSGYGKVTVSAQAVNGGTNGNIVAQDFNQVPCCGSNSVFISNNLPFSGGQDPVTYPIVLQSDIDGVVNGVQPALTQQAQNELKSKIHTNEQTVDSSSCSKKVDSNHQAGEHFGDVTVSSVSVTCQQKVYDQQGAQTLATDLLSKKATTDLGSGYVPLGTIMVTKTMLQPGTLDVVVNVKGTWVYQFSDTQQTALKKLIAGKHQTEAVTILKGQTGVGDATIQMNGSTLPTDPGQITFKIN